MRENEASIRGRVVRDLIAHTTNDLLIGKKIKNGELRKQIGTAEPPWKCPECFTMQTIEMEHFTMELLESKENANRDKIIAAARRRICRGDAQCIPHVCRIVQ